MKKFQVFLAASVVLAAWSLALADGGPLYGTPRGGPQALATADYGGYSYAISSFPVSGTGVNFSTVVIALPSDRSNFITGVFGGVIFSSGGLGALDFVDVFDSTCSERAIKEGAITRLYNVGYSTGGVTNTSSYFGFSGPPKPIRFTKGLIIRANVATYNFITSLYNRDR